MKTNDTATIDSDEMDRHIIAIRKRLRRVVDEFEGRDWEVHADLPGRKKPEPVCGEVPDVVALKDCLRIFVQVATLDTLRERESNFRTLARYAKEHEPLTRFDLALAVPEPGPGPRIRQCNGNYHYHRASDSIRRRLHKRRAAGAYSRRRGQASAVRHSGRRRTHSRGRRQSYRA